MVKLGNHDISLKGPFKYLLYNHHNFKLNYENACTVGNTNYNVYAKLIKLTKPFLFYLGSKFIFYNKSCNMNLHINKGRLEMVAYTFTFYI